MRSVRRALISALTALLLVLTLQVPSPADAAARLEIDGRGFGHGIGMSQYGAKGRADAGQTHSQILAAYYPGTTLGALPDSDTIRVWIQGDTDNQTWAVAEPGLSVQSEAGAMGLPSTVAGGTPALWRIRPDAGELILEARVAGIWRAHGDPDLAALLAGASTTDLVATDGAIRLVFGSTYREYRGSLRAVLVPGTLTSLRSVIVTTMADYVPSVVTAEMPASWHVNALRAQAVAARTYASFDRASRSASAWYDTCDTTSCQVFKGSADYNAAGQLISTNSHPRTQAAVTDTAGTVLLYDGAPAFTQFSASNGGFSVRGSRPYLVAAADPYDTYPEWHVSLSATDLEGVYPTIGSFRGASFTRDGNGPYGGRATSITLTGSTGSVTVSGTTFRSTFSLQSNLISASVEGLAIATPQRDWTVDARNDLIARSAGGQLYLWEGRGGTRWGSANQIGHGWHQVDLVTQTYNFGGTNLPEIFATDSSGRLRLYSGDGAGGFGLPRTTFGPGWDKMDLLVGVVGWDGAESTGLVARQRTTGMLLYYPGNGRGQFLPARQIGVGWNVLGAVLAAGDWDDDGHQDLFATNASTGALYLYRGNGAGGFIPGRTQIGTGWNTMDSLIGGADWDADGTWDILARERASGRLWLYPSDGSGRFTTRRSVGAGWSTLELVR